MDLSTELLEHGGFKRDKVEAMMLSDLPQRHTPPTAPYPRGYTVSLLMWEGTTQA